MLSTPYVYQNTSWSRKIPKSSKALDHGNNLVLILPQYRKVHLASYWKKGHVEYSSWEFLLSRVAKPTYKPFFLLVSFTRIRLELDWTMMNFLLFDLFPLPIWPSHDTSRNKDFVFLLVLSNYTSFEFSVPFGSIKVLPTTSKYFMYFLFHVICF